MVTATVSHLGALRGADWTEFLYLSDVAVAYGLLVTASAADGSMALWQVGPDGALSAVDRVAASATSGSYGLGDIWAGSLGGWTGVIPAGRYDDALAFHGIGPEGFEGAAAQWSGAAAGGYSVVLGFEIGGNAWVVGARRGSAGLFLAPAEAGVVPAVAAAGTEALAPGGVTALAAAEVGVRRYILAADGLSDAVAAFEIAADGTLAPRGTVSKDMGLPIDAPSALAVAEVGGTVFAVVAGSGTSSLTVLRLEAAGALVPVDHVLDSRETRFANVAALTAFEAGGRDFIAAGGTDGGITLFEIGIDGRLTTAAVIVDDHATALSDIGALTALADGDTALLFVASQGEGALDRFRISAGAGGPDLPAPDRPDLPEIVLPPLPDPDPAPDPVPAPAPDPQPPGPVSLAGTDGADDLIGGAGNDVILDGAGRDRLAGGAGADVFVFVYDRTADAVRDFDPAEDRVDLSLWKGARSLADLSITPTDWGAEVRFFEDAVFLAAADGGTLTAAALADAFLFG